MLNNVDMMTTNIFNMLSVYVIPELNELLKNYDKIQILIGILAMLLLVTIILCIIIIRRQKRMEKLLKELTEARAGTEEDISRND